MIAPPNLGPRVRFSDDPHGALWEVTHVDETSVFARRDTADLSAGAPAVWVTTSDMIQPDREDGPAGGGSGPRLTA